jgi:hypothetical protein
MQKKLTGWLILLIVILGPLQLGGAARSLGSVRDSFRPYFANYPSLSLAIMVYQLLMCASVALWVYTAWVLFRREPGTLGTAQATFAGGAVLRIASSFSVIVFGGLPPDVKSEMVERIVPVAASSLLMCTAWYMYLIRSERVREIYAA